MQVILKNDELVTINPNYGYKYGDVKLDGGRFGSKQLLERQALAKRQADRAGVRDAYQKVGERLVTVAAKLNSIQRMTFTSQNDFSYVDGLFRDIKSVKYDYEPSSMDFKLSAHNGLVDVRRFKELTLMQAPTEVPQQAPFIENQRRFYNDAGVVGLQSAVEHGLQSRYHKQLRTIGDQDDGQSRARKSSLGVNRAGNHQSSQDKEQETDASSGLYGTAKKQSLRTSLPIIPSAINHHSDHRSFNESHQSKQAQSVKKLRQTIILAEGPRLLNNRSEVPFHQENVDVFV